tara:strand:+ start:191 stop:481 length:291 start_codon:yes stop_codon:yes gene_type:complete
VAVKAKQRRTVVEEVTKLDKLEIEFLFELIKNSMIPGKHIQICYGILNKLKNQYQLYGKKNIVKGAEKTKQDLVKEKVKKVQRELKEQDGELWVKQ